MHEVFSCGFPHSDICGSLGVCPSPQLFAAYHVFLRLLVPRHPPCALFCLTSFLPYGRPLHSVAALSSFLFLDVFLTNVSHFSFVWFSSCSVWNFQGTYTGLCFALSGFTAGRSSIRLFPDAPAAGRSPLFCFLPVLLSDFSNVLAATCFPMPSPAQYPRPPAS